MFWHRRHLLWFPYLMLSMTIILAVAIVWSAPKDRPWSRGAAVEQGPSASEYQEWMRQTIAPSLQQIVLGDVDERALTEVRALVLATRVPSAYRDVHVQCVALLNQAIEGARGDAQALADAQVRVQALKQEAVWLF